MWYKGTRALTTVSEREAVILTQEIRELFCLRKEELSKGWLGAFVAAAFLLRLPSLFFREVIYNDGVEYIRIAQHILDGNWSEGFVPPLYPLLVGSVGFVMKDFELAGILISVIFGAAIVVPIYYFAKTLFDGRTAILASLFAVFQPLLFVYSGSVLTESTYYFIVALIAWSGWLAFSGGRSAHVLLFSFLSAMAYLTKPEGIGFLLIFLVWVLLVNPSPSIVRFPLRRLWMAVLAIVSFAVVSSPYLVQIRNDVGSWQLSKKAALSVQAVHQEEEEGIRERGQQQPRRKVDVSAYIRNPLSLATRVFVGFLQSLLKFQQSLTPYLFLFVFIGFLRKTKGRYPWRPNLYVLSHVVFFFGLVLPLFWITKRYTSQLIPMVLPWAAWGFLGLLDWISNNLKEGHVARNRLPTICLSIVLAALMVQGVLSMGRSHRQTQREVGLWMRDNLPREARIMSRLPQEGFYADMPWTRLRKETYGEIISDARAQKVRYLVVDEVVLRDVEDFEKNVSRGDLTLIKQWKKGGRQILLFKTTVSEDS